MYLLITEFDGRKVTLCDLEDVKFHWLFSDMYLWDLWYCISAKHAPHYPCCNVTFLFFPQTISYVIDRNACLMPAYFAIYELLKVFPNPRKWPHWVSKSVTGQFGFMLCYWQFLLLC